MNPTLVNLLTVATLFGGSLAIFLTLAAIERVAGRIRAWRGGRQRDGNEP